MTQTQFQMFAYPNRTHGIFEGAGTTTHLYTMLTKYLEEHLPAGGSRASWMRPLVSRPPAFALSAIQMGPPPGKRLLAFAPATP
ncbi:MAG: hypothetical protein ACYC1S_00415 [Gemmatimonadaceae bacterium]